MDTWREERLRIDAEDPAVVSCVRGVRINGGESLPTVTDVILFDRPPHFVRAFKRGKDGKIVRYPDDRGVVAEWTTAGTVEFVFRADHLPGLCRCAKISRGPQ